MGHNQPINSYFISSCLNPSRGLGRLESNPTTESSCILLNLSLRLNNLSSSLFTLPFYDNTSYLHHYNLIIVFYLQVKQNNNNQFASYLLSLKPHINILNALSFILIRGTPPTC